MATHDIGKNDLILRDNLAINRTKLANERTFLSYLRSSVALIIAGVSIISISTQPWFTLIGIICIPFGVFAGTFGVFRFTKVNRLIKSEE